MVKPKKKGKVPWKKSKSVINEKDESSNTPQTSKIKKGKSLIKSKLKSLGSSRNLFKPKKSSEKTTSEKEETEKTRETEDVTKGKEEPDEDNTLEEDITKKDEEDIKVEFTHPP